MKIFVLFPPIKTLKYFSTFTISTVL
jgi:hypothetical protein